VTAPRRLALLGTGLIGGSIGLALRRRGTEVTGFDHDAARAARAKEAGAVDILAASIAEAVDGADLVVVAVPVGQVADVVVEALDAGARLVTDVGSVKEPVVAAVEAERPDRAPRFVGGHPMAGSEQEGLDGASADLFVGATWVLTPTGHTDPEAFAEVRALAAELGAEAVAVAPELHDALVAVVSHVPQLAASTLMNVADTSRERHAVLLRLAAGGFRDMTRIAASHPAIWPDICVANRDAIVTALDEYLASLMRVRAMVASGDRDALLGVLQSARSARRNLPTGLPVDEPLVELRVPIQDRPGALAQVTTLAAELGVNISDVEMAHSLEGRGGVLVLVVSARGADAFEEALVGHGYHVARTSLS
jgi:prephenate dehydrogenase